MERAQAVMARSGVWSHGSGHGQRVCRVDQTVVDVADIDHVGIGTDSDLEPGGRIPVESGPGYLISEHREVFPAAQRRWLSLSRTATSHGLLVLAPARPGEVRDLALGILNELDGHFAHA